MTTQNFTEATFGCGLWESITKLVQLSRLVAVNERSLRSSKTTPLLNVAVPYSMKSIINYILCMWLYATCLMYGLPKNNSAYANASELSIDKLVNVSQSKQSQKMTKRKKKRTTQHNSPLSSFQLDFSLLSLPPWNIVMHFCNMIKLTATGNRLCHFKTPARNQPMPFIFCCSLDYLK